MLRAVNGLLTVKLTELCSLHSGTRVHEEYGRCSALRRSVFPFSLAEPGQQMTDVTNALENTHTRRLLCRFGTAVLTSLERMT